MDRYNITLVKRCLMCRTDVASVDEGGWCRGCVVRGHCTEQQIRVLGAVRRLQPTSITDVADEMGFASVSTAVYHLKALRDLRLVDWQPDLQRTLRETAPWTEGETHEP